MAPDDITLNHVIDVAVGSGGGANGFWQWRTLQALVKSGYKPQIVAGTSTGCLTMFLYAKGLHDEAEELYHEVYFDNARLISKPGIAKIKNGKLDVNWFKLALNLPRAGRITSLMDNTPLYEVILSLCKKKPSWECDFLFNYVDMKTGLVVNNSATDFGTNFEALASAITSSTTMPGIWPLNKERGDGGMRDGVPTDLMWSKLDPTKDYRLWELRCNKYDPAPAEDLDNIFKIAGRTLQILLNEVLRGDIARTQDRNATMIKLWPIIEELRAADLHHFADKLMEVFVYRVIPIHTITYSGNRGVFEFTREAYDEMALTADSDVSAYIKSNLNT